MAANRPPGIVQEAVDVEQAWAREHALPAHMREPPQEGKALRSALRPAERRRGAARRRSRCQPGQGRSPLNDCGVAFGTRHALVQHREVFWGELRQPVGACLDVVDGSSPSAPDRQRRSRLARRWFPELRRIRARSRADCRRPRWERPLHERPQGRRRPPRTERASRSCRQYRLRGSFAVWMDRLAAV